MNGGWAFCLLAAVVACGESPTSTSSPDATGGSAGAGGTPTGASGASAGAGEPGVTGGSGTAGNASEPCVDRASPECQPKAIDATAAATGLTVIGNDAYWRRVDKPNALLRTSLDTDETTEIVVDPAVSLKFEETPYLFNDGKNVFALSPSCCASIRNGLWGYYVADGAWKFLNLFVEQNIGGFLYASGSLVITFDQRFIRWYSPADLQEDVSKRFVMPKGETVHGLGTDGATLYMDVAGETAQIASFDGTALAPLATVPSYWSSKLAVDDTSLYFGAGTQLLSLDRAAPGEPKLLVDLAPRSPREVLVDAHSVYWVDNEGLYSMPKAGGTRQQLAQLELTLPAAVNQIDQSTHYIAWAGHEGLTKVRK